MKNLHNSLKIRNFVILNNLYLAQHSTAQHSTLLSSWFSVRILTSKPARGISCV